jgi:hypothetical protein
VNCRFLGNRATNGVCGAMENTNSSPTLVNCIFSGNQSTYDGGALANYQGSENTKVINCTFGGNVAGTVGGAISMDSTALTLTNAILWGNSDSDGSTQDSQLTIFSGTPGVNDCIVQGWTGSLGGTGNSGSDPLFVDAAGADATAGTTDDNLRLGSRSPAIATGDTAALPPDTADLNANANTAEATPLDLDGGLRVVHGIVDMGAYEFIPGDFDRDGDVDLADFGYFQGCFNGPNRPYATTPCADADFDADEDADLVDFGRFQGCFNVPNRLPGC